MSDATEGDYSAYLQQQLTELREAAGRRQGALRSQLAKNGQLNSGAALRLGVDAIDEIVSDYVDTLGMALSQWTGPNLPDDAARGILVRHIREVIDEMVTHTFARHGAPGAGAAASTMEALLDRVRDKLSSRARVIELGVRTKPAVQSVTHNSVTAASILGPIVQGGAGAVQSASVAINALEVAERLGELKAQLPPELQSLIKADADTIRAQVAKAEPNATILQEAGKSIRTIVEGAIGGILGNAAPAALPLFLSAVGLS